MSDAIIDLWSQAYRHTPCRIGLAKRNVEFTLAGLRLLCADDHVGLLGRDKEIAIGSQFVQRNSKALDRCAGRRHVHDGVGQSNAVLRIFCVGITADIARVPLFVGQKLSTESVGAKKCSFKTGGPFHL
jgi:hypothetical protein